jgi:hypothetical protein
MLEIAMPVGDVPTTSDVYVFVGGRDRLEDSIELLRCFHNPDGGWATYEETRGGEYYEYLNPAEVFGENHPCADHFCSGLGANARISISFVLYAFVFLPIPASAGDIMIDYT